MNSYPIVLAHGIARPDYLFNLLVTRLDLYRLLPFLASDRFHYFRNIASHLRQGGFEVYHSNVSFAAGLETRAHDLQRELQRILQASQQRKVHLIGHSMGGLDARYVIVHLGMAEQVASLTTIGTPHEGSSLADWVLEHGGDEVIVALDMLINLEGFRDLTIPACRAFNEAVIDAEVANSVVYQTYTGWQKREFTILPLQFGWQIIYEQEGDNDGLVPASSQRWTGKLVSRNGRIKTIRQHDFPFGADHINQMGWWHLYNERSPNRKWWHFLRSAERRAYELQIKNIYLQIARELRQLN